MQIDILKAETRTGSGTRDARAVRANGRIPAIIYGHGEDPVAITLDKHDLVVALDHGMRALKLDVGGKQDQCLIKEVQYDHLGIAPIHLDLTRVALDEKVQVQVGVELKGTPKGVADGGALEQNLTEIEVECLLHAIPETITHLVNDLGVDDSLFAKDLPLPEGVVLLTDGDERIATVRVVAEEEPEEEVEEGEEGGAEPERIGRVRAEDEASDS
jgi:large subunit ribosomal protein L25